MLGQVAVHVEMSGVRIPVFFMDTCLVGCGEHLTGEHVGRCGDWREALALADGSDLRQPGGLIVDARGAAGHADPYRCARVLR